MLFLSKKGKKLGRWCARRVRFRVQETSRGTVILALEPMETKKAKKQIYDLTGAKLKVMKHPDNCGGKDAHEMYQNSEDAVRITFPSGRVVFIHAVTPRGRGGRDYFLTERDITVPPAHSKWVMDSVKDKRPPRLMRILRLAARGKFRDLPDYAGIEEVYEEDSEPENVTVEEGGDVDWNEPEDPALSPKKKVPRPPPKSRDAKPSEHEAEVEKEENAEEEAVVKPEEEEEEEEAPAVVVEEEDDSSDDSTSSEEKVSSSEDEDNVPSFASPVQREDVQQHEAVVAEEPPAPQEAVVSQQLDVVDGESNAPSLRSPDRVKYAGDTGLPPANPEMAMPPRLPLTNKPDIPVNSSEEAVVSPTNKAEKKKKKASFRDIQEGRMLLKKSLNRLRESRGEDDFYGSSPENTPPTVDVSPSRANTTGSQATVRGNLFGGKGRASSSSEAPVSKAMVPRQRNKKIVPSPKSRTMTFDALRKLKTLDNSRKRCRLYQRLCIHGPFSFRAKVGYPPSSRDGLGAEPGRLRFNRGDIVRIQPFPEQQRLAWIQRRLNELQNTFSHLWHYSPAQRLVHSFAVHRAPTSRTPAVMRQAMASNPGATLTEDHGGVPRAVFANGVPLSRQQKFVDIQLQDPNPGGSECLTQELFDRHKDSNHPALLWGQGANQSLTYAGLFSAVEEFSTVCQNMIKAGPGDVIAICVRNCAEGIVATLAANRLGCTVLLLDAELFQHSSLPRNTGTPNSIRDMVYSLLDCASTTLRSWAAAVGSLHELFTNRGLTLKALLVNTDILRQYANMLSHLSTLGLKYVVEIGDTGMSAARTIRGVECMCWWQIMGSRWAETHNESMSDGWGTKRMAPRVPQGEGSPSMLFMSPGGISGITQQQAVSMLHRAGVGTEQMQVAVPPESLAEELDVEVVAAELRRYKASSEGTEARDAALSVNPTGSRSNPQTLKRTPSMCNPPTLGNVAGSNAERAEPDSREDVSLDSCNETVPNLVLYPPLEDICLAADEDDVVLACTSISTPFGLFHSVLGSMLSGAAVALPIYKPPLSAAGGGGWYRKSNALSRSMRRTYSASPSASRPMVSDDDSECMGLPDLVLLLAVTVVHTPAEFLLQLSAPPTLKSVLPVLREVVCVRSDVTALASSIRQQEAVTRRLQQTWACKVRDVMVLPNFGVVCSSTSGYLSEEQIEKMASTSGGNLSASKKSVSQAFQTGKLLLSRKDDFAQQTSLPCCTGSIGRLLPGCAVEIRSLEKKEGEDTLGSVPPGATPAGGRIKRLGPGKAGEIFVIVDGREVSTGLYGKATDSGEVLVLDLLVNRINSDPAVDFFSYELVDALQKHAEIQDCCVIADSTMKEALSSSLASGAVPGRLSAGFQRKAMRRVNSLLKSNNSPRSPRRNQRSSFGSGRPNRSPQRSMTMGPSRFARVRSPEVDGPRSPRSFGGREIEEKETDFAWVFVAVVEDSSLSELGVEDFINKQVTDTKCVSKDHILLVHPAEIDALRLGLSALHMSKQHVQRPHIHRPTTHAEADVHKIEDEADLFSVHKKSNRREADPDTLIDIAVDNSLDEPVALDIDHIRAQAEGFAPMTNVLLTRPPTVSMANLLLTSPTATRGNSFRSGNSSQRGMHSTMSMRLSSPSFQRSPKKRATNTRKKAAPAKKFNLPVTILPRSRIVLRNIDPRMVKLLRTWRVLDMTSRNQWENQQESLVLDAMDAVGGGAVRLESELKVVFDKQQRISTITFQNKSHLDTLPVRSFVASSVLLHWQHQATLEKFQRHFAIDDYVLAGVSHRPVLNSAEKKRPGYLMSSMARRAMTLSKQKKTTRVSEARKRLMSPSQAGGRQLRRIHTFSGAALHSAVTGNTTLSKDTALVNVESEVVDGQVVSVTVSDNGEDYPGDRYVFASPFQHSSSLPNGWALVPSGLGIKKAQVRLTVPVGAKLQFREPLAGNLLYSKTITSSEMTAIVLPSWAPALVLKDQLLALRSQR